MHWIAGIIELAAKWLVGNRKRVGWILHIVAGVLWTIVALRTEIYGLLVIAIPSFVVNLRNFYKWKEEV